MKRSQKKNALTISVLAGVWLFFTLTSVSCSEEPLGLPHPPGLLNWPATMAVDTDGRHLYVVNTNFDQRYRSGTVAVVDLQERLVLEDRTVAIDAFGGVPSLVTNAETGEAMELLLPTREEDRLYRIEITRSDDGAPALECNATESDELPLCSGASVFNEANGLMPGEEPYASTLIHDATHELNILVTAGLVDGSVHFFHLPADGPAKRIIDTKIDAEIQSMVFHPGTGELLFTHRRLSGIYALPISLGLDDGEPSILLGEKHFVFLPGDPLAGDYGREITLAPDGNQIAVVWRGPASVRFLEPDETVSSGYRMTTEIPVGRSPSEILFAPFGPGGATRVFVSCHRDDQVYVVDPDAAVVTDVIKVGKGPFGLAAIDRADLGRQLIVTANFEDNTLSVIEGDPASPFHLQTIAHVHSGEVAP